MNELSDKQITAYFRRCYTAVDGLWFMKVEEKYGFDNTLEIDNEVWKVLPKIQARFIKSIRKLGEGLEALYECLSTKMSIEEFTFSSEKFQNASGFKIIINRCPWHDLMIKSGRETLSGKVGTLICTTEYSVWASEFGKNIKFQLKHQICDGAESCVLQFSQ